MLVLYIKRHVENTVCELSKMFGAVLVADSRQVGKTTMFEMLTYNINYVTLNNPIIRTGAEEEIGTFLEQHPLYHVFISNSAPLALFSKSAGWCKMPIMYCNGAGR